MWLSYFSYPPIAFQDAALLATLHLEINRAYSSYV